MRTHPLRLAVAAAALAVATAVPAAGGRTSAAYLTSQDALGANSADTLLSLTQSSTTGVAGRQICATGDGRTIFVPYAGGPNELGIYTVDVASSSITTARTVALAGAIRLHSCVVVGSSVYITDQGNGSVHVLDSATWALTKSINTGASANEYGICAAGKYVYALSAYSGLIHRIRTSDKMLDATWDLDPVRGGGDALNPAPWGCAVLGSSIYVTGADDNDAVFVLDVTTGALLTKITDTPTPAGLCLSGTTVYAVGVASGTVQVINSATKTKAASVGDVGTHPYLCAAAPDGATVYVGGLGGVAMLDTASNSVRSVSGPADVGGVLVLSDSHHLFVTGQSGGSARIITW